MAWKGSHASISVPQHQNIVKHTKVERNGNMEKLRNGYLFTEIFKKQMEHMEKFPDAKIISLGIGDTTLPIPTLVTTAMQEYSTALSTIEGYRGYGPEQGSMALRKAIVRNIYKNIGLSESEVFISDGAQGDIARIQLTFGSNISIAVQDPTFPVNYQY
ncbi:putative LL-diaminopimelate aminotransferase [Dioscorea sansibarensis]